MPLIPKTNSPDADRVYTPDWLAKEIVDRFRPAGRILEPCKGGGAFLRAMPGCDWCELDEGRDFLAVDGKWDWIVTNPPWSKIRHFLAKAIELGVPDIVFLMNINAVATKARLRLIYRNDYHIKEMWCVDTPQEFPQMGFQLAAIHISRGSGPTTIGFR